MKLGFHTASLLVHDEPTAANELAKIGYSVVAIRPRIGGLDPSDSHFGENVLRFADTARRLNLRVVCDLDARYFHKHSEKDGPSLASSSDAEAAEAVAWIEKWIEIATEQQWDLITFSTGSNPDPNDQDVLDRLASRLGELSRRVESTSIRLAIRPVADHVLSSVSKFERLQQWLGAGHSLQLAGDVGEMVASQEFPIGERLTRCIDRLACVYLSKPQTSSSTLLGDVDLSMVTRALKDAGYEGPAIVRCDESIDHAFEMMSTGWETLR